VTIGNFTRVNAEAAAVAIAGDILDAFNRAEQLRSRCAAELAAGTLDLPGFYQGDAPDKAALLGFLDDMHAVYAGLQGTALPVLDYRRYLNSLIGL
jgi:hypothetical protein